MKGEAENRSTRLLNREDVPICGMDYNTSELTGVDGCSYIQVHSNLWVKRDVPDDPIVYLGTGKHGSGIILRPLFVNRDGEWRNIVNGKLAPSTISLKR